MIIYQLEENIRGKSIFLHIYVFIFIMFDNCE